MNENWQTGRLLQEVVTSPGGGNLKSYAQDIKLERKQIWRLSQLIEGDIVRFSQEFELHGN